MLASSFIYASGEHLVKPLILSKIILHHYLSVEVFFALIYKNPKIILNNTICFFLSRTKKAMDDFPHPLLLSYIFFNSSKRFKTTACLLS